MPLSMSTLNSNFGRGFTLSKYYGTEFSSGNAPTTGAINYNTFVGKSSFYNYVYPTGFTSPLFVFDSMSVPCTTTSSSNTDGRFSQCNWYYYSNFGTSGNGGLASVVTPTNPSYNTTRKTLPLNGNWLSFNLYDNVFATLPITGWNTSNHTVIMILYWIGTTTSQFTVGGIGGVFYDIGRFGCQSTQVTGVGQHIAGDVGYWTYDSSAGTTNASLLSLTSNNFVMVSVVKSSSPTGSIVYYKNDVQTSSNADTKVCSGPFFVGISQRDVWFGNSKGQLNAELAYCGVWNTALTAAQISNFYTSNLAQFGVVTASGGNTIAVSSGRRFHTFTASGTFVMTSAYVNVEIMLIGGGGGGGVQSGGGGGAGNMIVMRTVLTPGSYSVVVGLGGAGGNNTVSHTGTNGQNSSFGSIATALGGGGGGGYNAGTGGLNGGCGGGGSELGQRFPGSGVTGTVTSGTVVSNLATSGGLGINNGSEGAPGGGGTGAPGTDHTASTSRGDPGGAGTLYYGTYYGGGGGGSQGGTIYLSPYNGGAGGVGGGGTGSSYGGPPAATSLVRGTAGSPNTGGGGGGATLYAGDDTGLSGGSGIVIISYVVSTAT